MIKFKNFDEDGGKEKIQYIDSILSAFNYGKSLNDSIYHLKNYLQDCGLKDGSDIIDFLMDLLMGKMIDIPYSSFKNIAEFVPETLVWNSDIDTIEKYARHEHYDISNEEDMEEAREFGNQAFSYFASYCGVNDVTELTPENVKRVISHIESSNMIVYNNGSVYALLGEL